MQPISWNIKGNLITLKIKVVLIFNYFHLVSYFPFYSENLGFNMVKMCCDYSK